MSCTEWQSRLDAYVDGELPAPEMETFRDHAVNCSHCAAAALALMEMKGALRRAGRRYPASPELRTRVLASTMTTSAGARSRAAKPKAGPSSVLSWPGWVMAAAAVLLLMAGLLFFARRYTQPAALGEFADLHIATLASANPVEVVSNDRHTVKPWFQGRIPFTFDLPDLQGSPFTLTGGRVAYFHQEPGAHLLFAYQRHLVSAFIFRDTPQLAIHRGSFSNRETSFNLRTWTQDGLRYVLVGDVNAASLRQLADLWQQHPR